MFQHDCQFISNIQLDKAQGVKELLVEDSIERNINLKILETPPRPEKNMHYNTYFRLQNSENVENSNQEIVNKKYDFGRFFFHFDSYERYFVTETHQKQIF